MINDTKSDFDPYAPTVTAQGPAAFAELAQRCPVHHYRGRFDFFIANDPSDIRDRLLADPSVWTIEEGSSPKLLPVEQRTALMDDSPYHNKIRYIIQRGFSTAELKRLESVVEGLSDELIETMLAVPEQAGDFFQLFVMPLPARLMCLMLGVPEEHHHEYKSWADSYFYDILNDPNKEMSLETIGDVSAPLFLELERRRSFLRKHGQVADLSLLGNILPDDFLSRFMCEKIDGQYLRDDEILSLMLGIIVGGNETTMNLIGNLLIRLLRDRTQWEALLANPTLIDVAIEESLRLDPPVIGMFRAARHDTELSGVPVSAHSKVFYNIAAANRDPDMFTDPNKFRLDRPRSELRKHVAFSGGNHSCLGAPLARMEVRVVFQKLLARLPSLMLDGTPVRAAGFNVFGWTRIPVRWG